MQKMGLRWLIRAKKCTRHIPSISDEYVPSVLKRDFCASAPNQKWATDVAEFNLNGLRFFVSVIGNPFPQTVSKLNTSPKLGGHFTQI